jgi:two-component system response regulator YesN
MKSVILVDDEALIKQHLREHIPWAAWGYRIVGEAANGEEAQGLCEALQPDIALIDITMPVMDGLTLLGHLNRDHPDLRCIILTAHRDFNYAQRAIHHHVCGYILKSPLQLAEVQEALSRASRDIEANRTLLQTRDEQQMLLHQYQYPLRRQFFDHILRGVLAEPEEIIRSGQSIGIRLAKAEYRLLLCKVDELMQYKLRYPRKDDSLLEFSMLEIVRETLQELAPGRFELFPIALGQFAILLLQGGDAAGAGTGAGDGAGTGSGIGAGSEEFAGAATGAVMGAVTGIGCLGLGLRGYGGDVASLVADFNRKLERPMRQYMDLQLCIAVGRPFRSSHRMREGHGECAALLAQRFYQREVRPIFAEGAVSFQPWPGEVFDTLQREFTRIWSEFTQEAFGAWLQKSTNAGRLWRPDPGRLCEWLASLRPDDTAGLSAESLPPWPDFTHASSLYLALGRLAMWVRERQRINHATPVRAEIAKAIQWIKSRLHEELTLDIIAREVQLSSSYLGQLFKREAGSSIVDYIQEQRMELAKRFLASGEFRNYELAEKVGFNNYPYFCTMFKKHTGMTPNQFRSSVKPHYNVGMD